jgi:hypothetical protein
MPLSRQNRLCVILTAMALAIVALSIVLAVFAFRQPQVIVVPAQQQPADWRWEGDAPQFEKPKRKPGPSLTDELGKRLAK